MRASVSVFFFLSNSNECLYLSLHWPDECLVVEMQYVFVKGRGTTDAIFIVRQLQEKHLSMVDSNNKDVILYFAFVDLEKAFDRVPRKVLCWAMRTLGIPESIVRVV